MGDLLFGIGAPIGILIGVALLVATRGWWWVRIPAATTTYNWKPVVGVMAAVLAIVGIVLLVKPISMLLPIDLHIPDRSAIPLSAKDWDAVWFWGELLVGALIALVLTFTLLLQINKHGGAILKYKKISTAMAFAVLLYVLAAAFHPELREKLVTSEGVGLLILAMFGFAILVIIKEVFWKDSWVTAVIMILLLVLVLDTGIMERLGLKGGDFGKLLENIHLPSLGGSGTRQAYAPPPAPAVRQASLGVQQEITLGSTPVELNPGGRYKMHWHELDHRQCINLYGPSSQYLGNDCKGDVDLKDVAMFASARGDLVHITYMLTPP